MTIVFSGSFLTKKHIDGIGNFTYNIINAFALLYPSYKIIVICDKAVNSELIINSNVKIIKTIIPIFNGIITPFWINFLMPYYVNKTKPDVFISPDGFLPKRINSKTINVIHDLNFLTNPAWVNIKMRNFVIKSISQSTNYATRVATVSAYSKNDIANNLLVDKNRIDVLYNGVDSLFVLLSEEEKIVAKAKYTQAQNYFLFVGTLHPRKNIGALIKAFDQFKKIENNCMKLVFAGLDYWWTNEDKTILEQAEFKDDIIFTGRIPDTDLPKIIGAATALTYVPFFEGFGIPVLEAFSCGVPVITSNVTSLPEVAADAAILVDPNDIDAIANAMRSLIVNNDLKNDLIKRGLQRVQEFTWKKSAERLQQCIIECLK